MQKGKSPTGERKSKIFSRLLPAGCCLLIYAAMLAALFTWTPILPVASAHAQSLFSPGPGGVVNTTSVICGNKPASPSGATAGGGNSGYAEGANPCTPAANVSVINCGAYFTTASGNVDCAIYNDNGLSGSSDKPSGAPLCHSASVANTSGFQTLDLTSAGCPGLVSGSKYWIVFSQDNNATALGLDSGGPSAVGVYYNEIYPTFPSGVVWIPWPAASTLDVFLTVH